MFHLINVGVGLALTQLQEGYIWKPAGLSTYHSCQLC